MEKTAQRVRLNRDVDLASPIYIEIHTHTCLCANLDTILTLGNDVLHEIIQQLKGMERVILFSHNQKSNREVQVSGESQRPAAQKHCEHFHSLFPLIQVVF